MDVGDLATAKWVVLMRGPRLHSCGLKDGVPGFRVVYYQRQGQLVQRNIPVASSFLYLGRRCQMPAQTLIALDTGFSLNMVHHWIGGRSREEKGWSPCYLCQHSMRSAQLSELHSQPPRLHCTVLCCHLDT